MWLRQVSRVELSRFKGEPTNSRCTKECHEFQRGLILWLWPMLDIYDFPWRHLFHSCGFENSCPLSIFAIATFQRDCGPVRVEPRCQKASVEGGGGDCAEPPLDQCGTHKRQKKYSTPATCSYTNLVGSFHTPKSLRPKKRISSPRF